MELYCLKITKSYQLYNIIWNNIKIISIYDLYVYYNLLIYYYV